MVESGGVEKEEEIKKLYVIDYLERNRISMLQEGENRLVL